MLLADAKSHFSIGESLLLPKDVAQQAKASGYKAAALCDTMSISSMPEFTKACDAEGIKPIIGVRLRIVPTLDHVDKVHTVFPKIYILTDDGFKIVTKLLSLANDEEHFYRVARLLWSDLIDALKDAQGHIAYSTGSLYSALRDENVSDVTKEISNALTRSMTFVEIAPGNSAVWDRTAEVGYQLAEKLDLPILLSRPALFEGESMTALGLMHSIANNHKRRYGEDFQPHLCDYVTLPPKTLASEAIKQVKRLQMWKPGLQPYGLKTFQQSWDALTDAVEYKWQKLDVTLPKMADDEDAELWRLAKIGLKKRMTTEVFGHKPDDLKTYVARLKYEMDVLTSMGFAGYFLLTRDIVMWAKDNGIRVGPGRGSVGGSLVAYALEITDVDPIRFNLIFERFINPERLDLPDADLDFMSTRRHEVFEYIREKYGEDYTAGIANYVTLASRGALSDLGRIMDVKNVHLITKILPEEGGSPISLERAIAEVPEVTKFAAENREFWDLSRAIEGRMRTLSQHAAGVVVAGEPIINRAVVERRKGSRTVNWDKDVVEDMGLIKMDILGLSTLDLIDVALRKIKERHGIDVDLSQIPLDDPKVLKAFGEGKTVGVFQFESGGMRRLLKDLNSTGDITFDDVTAATALYRPGPMEAGLMDDYVSIKAGDMAEHYEHEALRGALSSTYSVIVYQEQVMRIAQDLCGFTMAEADHLRKAIGKKNLKKMEEQGGHFIEGAVKSGMDEDAAQSLWDKIVKFAGYAFNASHSVEYTLISYQSMWLKTYYPAEFFAGALTILSSEKRPGIVADAESVGIKVLPPDVNVSTHEFEVIDDKTLTASLPVINGLSEKGALEIARARKDGPFKSMVDFEERVTKRIINIRVRERLNLIGAFASIEPDQPPADDPERQKYQLEIIPTIMSGGIRVTRIPNTKGKFKKDLNEVLNKMVDRPDPSWGDGVMCLPRTGKDARFMVVFDGPGRDDERAATFRPEDSDAISKSLSDAGLSVHDAYWTALCKVPKKHGEKIYDPEVIRTFGEVLKQEIDIVNPQVVLVLGTAAARFFNPGMKGGITDHCGKVIYQPAEEGKINDRNIILGITPGMIYFDGSKQVMLDDVFAKVSEMIYGS